VTLLALTVASLSALLMVIAEMPVSATSPGTTFLTAKDSSFTVLVHGSATGQTTEGSLRRVASRNERMRARVSSRTEAHRSTSTIATTNHSSTPATPANSTDAPPTKSVTPTTTTTIPTTTTATGDGAAGTTSANTTTPPTTTTTEPAPVLRVSNPAANIVPTPNFLDSGQCTSAQGDWTCVNPCVTSALKWPTYSNDVGCSTYILEAIDAARSDEGLASMVLPSNWYSLSPTEQLFVVANLERTARGLPPYLGLNAALSADAQQAAQADTDPAAAPGFAIGNDAQGVPGMGGAWAGGFSVLAADYVWMYDDGWGGSSSATSNISCTSATSSGCWAHRDELLGSDPGYNPGVGLNCQDCEMGTGYAVVNGSSSFVDLIEVPKGAPPAMNFTWSEELSQGF
jgi:hypothetical protein